MIFYIPFGLDVGAILYCVGIFLEPFFSDFLDSDFLDSDFLAIFKVSLKLEKCCSCLGFCREALTLYILVFSIFFADINSKLIGCIAIFLFI